MWQALIELTRVFSQTPDSDLVAALEPIFDIHGALWHIALENVFTDGDGCISRGSDYALYRDPSGVFPMITHDNNETFSFAGGGGPNRWPSSDPMLSQTGHERTASLPVISRLLGIEKLRQRYLSYYRTLIEPIVRADAKKLYSTDAARSGLRASFALSGDGESVILMESDANGNRILDRVGFAPMAPTPGAANRAP